MIIQEINKNDKPHNWKIYPKMDLLVMSIKEHMTSSITYRIETCFYVPIIRRKITYLVSFRKNWITDTKEHLEQGYGAFITSVIEEVEQIKEKFKLPKLKSQTPDDHIIIYKIRK